MSFIVILQFIQHLVSQFVVPVQRVQGREQDPHLERKPEPGEDDQREGQSRIAPPGNHLKVLKFKNLIWCRTFFLV